jgi:hypothetical protein
VLESLDGAEPAGNADGGFARAVCSRIPHRFDAACLEFSAGDLARNGYEDFVLP